MHFEQWICVFPGKMGLSWKPASGRIGSKEEIELEAEGYRNTVAIPLQLFETMKDHERRMVVAEQKVNEARVVRENELYNANRKFSDSDLAAMD